MPNPQKQKENRSICVGPADHKVARSSPNQKRNFSSSYYFHPCRIAAGAPVIRPPPSVLVYIRPSLDTAAAQIPYCYIFLAL